MDAGAPASWQPSPRYPDPAVQIVDESFTRYRLANAKVERVATGCRWAEGPVWFGDGRYLLCEVQGDMAGMPFQGMGCLGYDNTLKKYVAAWIDNMGTGIMRSEGTSSDGGKTITFAGDMLCPIEHTATPYKYTYEIKNNDEFVMRWWSPAMSDGKMFESMVITYTRAK